MPDLSHALVCAAYSQKRAVCHAYPIERQRIFVERTLLGCGMSTS